MFGSATKALDRSSVSQRTSNGLIPSGLALGADPRRLVQATFARAAKQLLAGVALGAVVALRTDQLAGGAMLRRHAAMLVPAVAVLMLLIGLLAAVDPARPAVRINPIETLRAE